MVSPLSGSSGYEGQLEIILTQQLKIEDLQQKLIDNGGSYATMLRREEDVQLKFVDLMVQTYPQLASFSPPEIVTMMESLDLPPFVSLHTQITSLLGSYSSIVELQNALDAAERLVVQKTSEKTWQTQGVANAEAALAQAKVVQSMATFALKADYTPENLDAWHRANAAVASAEQDLTRARQTLAITTAELAAAELAVVPLRALFKEVSDLDIQLQALIESNPFYALYDGFSDVEKELIALFSN